MDPYFQLHKLGNSPRLLPIDDPILPALFHDLIAELIQGILILTPEGEVVYINESAQQTLRKLQPGACCKPSIPQEIWHLCQSLIQSRCLFPSQYWRIESEVLIDTSLTLRIEVRWLQIEQHQEYLLLVLNDQQRSLRSFAIAEAQKYGFTARETEIWLLHRASSTYKQIATALGITPNTVKKHILNIHAKQKAFANMQSAN